MTEVSTIAYAQAFDAATWQNMPHGGNTFLYSDGRYAAPASAARTLEAVKVRRISVLGDYRTSSALDWEPGNECFTPGGLRRFVRGRRGMDELAIPYCDRADAAEALAALRDFGHGSLLEYPGLFWWIGTLDGKTVTAEELAVDLADNYDAPIPADRLFGDQYVTRNGPDGYDATNLYMSF